MTQAPVIDKIKFDEFFEANVNIAKSKLTDDPQAEMPPHMMVMTVDDGGQWTAHMIMFANFGPDRHVVLASLGAKFGTERKLVTAVYLAVEAWGLKVPHGERAAGPIKDHPDSENILVVMGYTMDQHVRVVRHKINRIRNFVALEQMPDYPGLKVKSSLVAAFIEAHPRALLTSTAKLNS